MSTLKLTTEYVKSHLENEEMFLSFEGLDISIGQTEEEFADVMGVINNMDYFDRNFEGPNALERAVNFANQMIKKHARS